MSCCDVIIQEAVGQQLEQWMVTFDLSSRHANLVVKDPNYCTELVAKELYTAYSAFVSEGFVEGVACEGCVEGVACEGCVGCMACEGCVGCMSCEGVEYVGNV